MHASTREWAYATPFFLAFALHAQSVTPIPASIQDFAGQYPASERFSFEQQIQTGTQGNSTNGNAFAYWHGIQVRPWFHYDGIPNITLTSSASYIDYFKVPGTSNEKHPEWRFIG